MEAALDKIHTWQAASPDTDLMMFQTLQYEVYEMLKVDAAALELCYSVAPTLHAALHAAKVLDELREGTGCYQPTWDEETFQTLPEDTRERWLDALERDEAAEDLVLETLVVLLDQTHNYPLSVELTQYLVTYKLAVEFSKVQPKAHLRKETTRCIKLAKYLTPWVHRNCIGYICHRDGEVFLLDGEIDKGTCGDYLDAIRQAEQSISHNDLKRFFKERTGQPSFDSELGKAVHIWLGDEYKRWGKPAE